MNLIFGINWKLGALIMLAVLTVLYFSKGVYSKVEKGILDEEKLKELKEKIEKVKSKLN